MVNVANFVNAGKTIFGAAVNYKGLIAEKCLPTPAYPLFFLKPVTTYITEGELIEIPDGFTISEEIELGVVIGKECKNVSEEHALEYVGGYCAALDMTGISKIDKIRANGEPWTMAKAFDTATPVSRFITKDEIPDPHNVNLWCKVNGRLLQNESTSDLLFNVPKIISYISKHSTLAPNTLILTGSPRGMETVYPGDKIECGITGIVTMEFQVKG